LLSVRINDALIAVHVCFVPSFRCQENPLTLFETVHTSDSPGWCGKVHCFQPWQADMSGQDSLGTSKNRLLACLSAADRGLLEPCLKPVHLKFAATLGDAQSANSGGVFQRARFGFGRGRRGGGERQQTEVGRQGMTGQTFGGFGKYSTAASRDFRGGIRPKYLEIECGFRPFLWPRLPA
jgi:hypothetical protein